MFGRKKFKADGVYLGRPYQVDRDGRVDVDFGDRIERFSDVDAMVSRLDEIEAQRDIGPLPYSDPAPPENKSNKGCGCLFAIAFLALVIGAISNSGTQTKYDQQTSTTSNSPKVTNQLAYSAPSSSPSVTDIINTQFGRVCHATIEGFFASTLRLDWTAETNKLNAMTVLAAIGKAKEVMYDKGIRYLKFPNNAGTYNVIDWKTGEKSVDGDRARYYFP